MESTKPKPKRAHAPPGWLKISEPQDLERALVRMLNKILTSDDPLEHGGRFASIANAWINSRKLRLESEELKAIDVRLTVLEKKRDKHQFATQDFRK